MRWIGILALMPACLVAHGEARIDWMQTVYSDGRHNAFTDLILWKGLYYVCFRHGESHMSMDGEIRILSSPDLKTWTPCGTLDTFGDDRDPHFVATDDTLHVYFGTWNLEHRPGNALPDRGAVRSYFTTTKNGAEWSAIQGVYEPGFWLWRVRRGPDGAFYSPAYTATRPKPTARETRLLRSEDGLEWSLVSVAMTELMAGEADMLFVPDGTIRMLTRTGSGSGTSYWLQSDPMRNQWTQTDSGVLVHAPVFATHQDRVFVAGRGRDDRTSVTRLWEAKGDALEPLLTLPSGGDTSYPGMLVDPATENGEHPALFITWYSQHETPPGSHAAAVYVARILIDGAP